jgi:hypothetical protein
MVSLLARDWALMNVVWWGRRYNKSLNRSGISEPFIRKTRMLDSLLPARLIPPLCGFNPCSNRRLNLNSKMPIENPLVKIGDTVINLNNVASIKPEGGNLNIDFISGGDHVHRITLSGMEAVRFSAFLTSVVHELHFGEK